MTASTNSPPNRADNPVVSRPVHRTRDTAKSAACLILFCKLNSFFLRGTSVFKSSRMPRPSRMTRDEMLFVRGGWGTSHSRNKTKWLNFQWYLMMHLTFPLQHCTTCNSDPRRFPNSVWSNNYHQPSRIKQKLSTKRYWYIRLEAIYLQLWWFFSGH